MEITPYNTATYELTSEGTLLLWWLGPRSSGWVRLDGPDGTPIAEYASVALAFLVAAARAEGWCQGELCEKGYGGLLALYRGSLGLPDGRPWREVERQP